MKSLKIDHDLAQLIRQGKKRSTWRINDDKNLSVDDKVELIDKVDPQKPNTWLAFGLATVNAVVSKRLKDIVDTDFDSHERYSSKEEMLSTYKRYYGADVTPYSHVKIVQFSFEPYGKAKVFDPQTSQKLTEMKLFADGGSRGNPGPSAAGFALTDMENNLVKKDGVYLGITTNNQAEYLALKSGLEAAKLLGARQVHVYMDSLLVVNQMKGIFKVKNRDLRPINEAIKEYLAQFKEVNFAHVPREFNKLADSMVNEILDAAAKNP